MKEMRNSYPKANHQAELNQPLFRLALKHSLLIIIILLLLSIALAWLVVNHTDQVMREEILVQTRMVARAINAERVSSLKGSTDDLANDDYQRLKEQMAAIKQANEKCRFIYLMDRQPDGTIIFLVDNEPPESEGYSAPGDIFEDASLELLEAFDTGQGFVEGPVVDQWGVWISALMPIMDPQTGEVIALFGMDIDASTWRRSLASTAILPVGTVFSSFFLLAMLIIIWRNRNIISESRKELLAMKNFNEEIVQNASEGILIADRKGTITYANPAIESMLGYDSGELLSRDWMNLVPQEMKERALQTDKARMQGLSERYELNLLKKDGTPLPFQISASPRHDDYNDEFIGSLAVMTNISALQEAEQAIRESEEKYRLIFERSPLGVLHFDNKGTIIDCNENFVKIIGSSYDKLIGLSMLKLPDQGIVQAVKKAIKGEAATYEDYYKSVAANKVTPVRASFAPIITYKSAPDLANSGIGIIEDITVRKKAEEHILHISLHDQLTGLYNRYFVETELKRLDTERQLPFSIIMADVNGLKLVNDTYGHMVGDNLLCRAAAIIKENNRSEDIVARWGGDEFVILLPQTQLEEALQICRRINEGCENEFIENLPVSIALGAAIRDNTAISLHEVLKAAEDNMYEHKLTESRSTKNTVLNALLKALAAKSFETEAHTHNMQDIAMKIAKELGLPDSEINRLVLLITLHDIGKINIPEEILTKKGRLTDQEWETIKKHPEIGHRIAMATEEFSHVAEDILSHHERFDGKGYPRGLQGEKIPLLARITSIADAFEVMSNGRPYKKALSISDIIKEYKRCSGTQFDPALVEIMMKIL